MVLVRCHGFLDVLMPINLASALFRCLPAPRRRRASAPPRCRRGRRWTRYPGCSLVALDENGSLRIEQAAARSTLPRFIELRQEGAVLPAFPTSNFVLLTNGDRIPLDPEAAANLAESRLRVWPAKSLPPWSQTSLTLYAPHVVLLFWSVPDGVDDGDLFFAKLQEGRRKLDVAYLRNGDRIEGTLSEISAEAGVVIVSDRKKVQTPWSKLAGIAWNTERQARLRTSKPHWHAVLNGGARLNFLDLRLDEKSRVWTGKTQFGATLELPLESVLSLEARQGPAVELAELTPSRHEQRPYLGISWPLAKNAAVTGHPLRLSSGAFEKGVAMHAPCRVAYALNGGYLRFDSLVGFDDNHRAPGPGAPRDRTRRQTHRPGRRQGIDQPRSRVERATGRARRARTGADRRIGFLRRRASPRQLGERAADKKGMRPGALTPLLSRER